MNVLGVPEWMAQEDAPAWVGDPGDVEELLLMVGSGILEVVSNPWRFILVNWFCDIDLVSPTGIDRFLIKKDLLADSYSDLEAFILDEKRVSPIKGIDPSFMS
ncbi:hypothetical protein HKD37_17G048758 [Glycine soja]